MDNVNAPAYRRVILKLSGEALSAGVEGILDFNYIAKIGQVIRRCLDAGVQIGIVVGAGNIWRGARNGVKLNRANADNMGMLATTINSIALSEGFRSAGVDARVMTAVPMEKFGEYYTASRALDYLNDGKVVIVGCGIGSPFFSTDTPAVLRALELEADALLLAKSIDYVYTDDPRKNPDAKKIEEITYLEILEKQLKVIDMTAAALAMEGSIPTLLFGLDNPQNIYKVIMGEKLGTIVKGGN